MSDFAHKIYALLPQIPPGHAVTYGQIAMAIGHPRAARQVGQAMRRCPEHLPWQRVVHQDGSISGGEYAFVRRALLESEGTPFLPDGRVDLLHCRYIFNTARQTQTQESP